MDFLRRLFGGRGTPTGPDGDRGLYMYVRPKHCKEIVVVRIDPLNDLSRNDTGDGFFVRKMARAIRCPFPAEFTLYFDKGRRFVDSEISDGEFVEEEEYLAWAEAQEGGDE